jgi:hypothetical protein
VYYSYVNPSSTTAEIEATEYDANGRKRKNGKSSSLTPSQRSKLILRARKQFDLASHQFLSTLRIKIVEVVDVISAVRQIKELRASGSEDSKEIEAKLWEDIKIGSFTLFFVTIYMVSALTVLLKVQMHILARAVDVSSDDPEKVSDWEDENQTFKLLVESTYKHLFGSGLNKLTNIIRQRLTTDMVTWTVRDRLNVSYLEIVQLMSGIRESLESDIQFIIRDIIVCKYRNFI